MSTWPVWSFSDSTLALKQHALLSTLLGAALVPIAAALAPLPETPLAFSLTKPAIAASPLSKSLQGKPVLVEVYATWCSACQNIKPVMNSLRQKEGNSVHWVRFDVSNPTAAKQSATRAEKLGLSQFFKSNRSQTSLVSIFNPETGAAVNTFRAQTKIDPYLKAIKTTRAMLNR